MSSERALVKALRELVRTSRAMFSDPMDFGPYTERCKREYEEASKNASRLIRAYRKENSGKESS